MTIIIEEFNGFSRCTTPDGTILYGTCVEDVSETLDCMARAGILESEVEVTRMDDDFGSLEYNV